MSDTSRVRVLVIEDEERLASVIAEGLRADRMEVDVEHDGPSGLWRASVGSYDVIVLDIMLGGMSGYQVCRSLRESENWTPVLMLTAKSGELDEAEALDTGADDFLRKPFSFTVLMARLRALARRGAPERPAVLTAGPVSLDPASGTVIRCEQEIALTRREYAVLELLMRANGTTVSSEAILDRVWGIDVLPGSNVVQVNIRYLRRKLDDPFEYPVIETVRHKGYRLVVEPSTTT